MNFLLFGLFLGPVLGDDGVAEYAMLAEKLANYPIPLKNGSGRPVLSYEDKTELSIELVPMHMTQLDDQKQILSILAALRLRWKDPYLSWEKSDSFKHISVVSIEHDQAWTPTVVHLNNIETSGIVASLGERAHLFVNQDGRVTWEPTGIYKSSCELKLTNFPFDRQKCEMIFEPWPVTTNANGSEDAAGIVLVDVSLQPPSAKQFLFPGSIWSLEDFTYEKVGNQARYKIMMRRNFQHTLYNVIIPCALLSVLQISSFGIRADTADRPAYSVTILLAFSLFQVMINDDMPETSDIIYLLIYVIVQFGIGTLATVHSVVVSYFLVRREMKKAASEGIPFESVLDELPANYAVFDKVVFLILMVACVASHILIFGIMTLNY